MDGEAIPKPHSLRLSRDLDARVRAYAKSISKPGSASRLPLGRALVALIEAGLNSVQADRSPKDGMLLALHELDPEWTGRRLQDFEPLAVTTRSGKSPLQILEDRRG
jgi:hypothetical protein